MKSEQVAPALSWPWGSGTSAGSLVRKKSFHPPTPTQEELCFFSRRHQVIGGTQVGTNSTGDAVADPIWGLISELQDGGA